KEDSPNRISLPRHSSRTIPNRSDPSFGERVQVWTPAGKRQALHIRCRQSVPERRAELPISIVQNVTAGIQITPGPPGGVSGGLLHPTLGGMRGGPGRGGPPAAIGSVFRA